MDQSGFGLFEKYIKLLTLHDISKVHQDRFKHLTFAYRATLNF